MRFAFWEWMITGGDQGSSGDKGALEQSGLIMRDGKLKSARGAYRARDLFNVPLDREDGPLWTFDRMGATCSQMTDGRNIWIGGEHEDSYDPDFCIYNDVVVLGESELQIYGYPKEVFPPTDFHSATITSKGIVIVGGLGYADARRTGDTPVYLLDVVSYRIREMATSGPKAGWIFKHDARLGSPESITISRGEIFEERDGRTRYRRNVEDYALDLNLWEWKRLTNRNWRQFFIRQENNRLFVLDRRLQPDSLVPSSIDSSSVQTLKWNRIAFKLNDVSIELTVGIGQIEIIVQGELSPETSARLTREITEITEHAIQARCILES